MKVIIIVFIRMWSVGAVQTAEVRERRKEGGDRGETRKRRSSGSVEARRAGDAVGAMVSSQGLLYSDDSRPHKVLSASRHSPRS